MSADKRRLWQPVAPLPSPTWDAVRLGSKGLQRLVVACLPLVQKGLQAAVRGQGRGHTADSGGARSVTVQQRGRPCLPESRATLPVKGSANQSIKRTLARSSQSRAAVRPSSSLGTPGGSGTGLGSCRGTWAGAQAMIGGDRDGHSWRLGWGSLRVGQVQ